MKKIYAFATLCLLTLAGSCNKFLDVVPNDGIATLDMAFNLRSTAERYLGTCYSYMPIEGNVIHDPAMLRENPRYSAALKRRILGERGHLSNETCARGILTLYESGVRRLVLGHLSA